MKPVKPREPASKGSPKTPDEAESIKPGELGITERRRSIRPLPVPDTVESDGDTDWAAFQALISDKPHE